LRKYFRRK